MENSFLISIIVPIYNADKHLSKCIESILNQNYKNIEVLLLNDGSKDDSLKICKSFSKIDKRIIVIDQINQGVSITRNKGIEYSTGDYILFIDADDYVSPTYIDNFLKQEISQDCLLIQDYIRIKKGEEIRMNNYEYKEFNTSDLEKIFKNNVLVNGYPFCKFYNSYLIKKNNLKFNSGIKFSEDLIFFLDYCKYIKKIKFINSHNYFYLIHQESASYKNYKYEEMENTFKLFIKKLKEIEIYYNKDVFNNLSVRNSLSKFLTFTLLTIYDPRNAELYNNRRIEYLKKFSNIYDLNIMKQGSFTKKIYVELLQKKLFNLTNACLKLYLTNIKLRNYK